MVMVIKDYDDDDDKEDNHDDDDGAGKSFWKWVIASGGGVTSLGYCSSIYLTVITTRLAISGSSLWWWWWWWWCAFTRLVPWSSEKWYWWLYWINTIDDNNGVWSHCVHQIFVSEKVKRVNAEKCKQNLNVTPMRRDKSDKDQTEIWLLWGQVKHRDGVFGRRKSHSTLPSKPFPSIHALPFKILETHNALRRSLKIYSCYCVLFHNVFFW